MQHAATTAVLVAALASCGQAAPLVGFIVLGQSNACGRATVAEATDPAIADPVAEGIRYGWREISWQTLSVVADVPTGPLAPHPHPNDLGGQYVGVSLSLGRRLADHFDDEVLLANVCSGGTNIFRWLPDRDELYPFAVDYLSGLDVEAGGVDWRGVFFLQGESDQHNQNWLVDDRVAIIRDALAADLNAPDLWAMFAPLKDNLVDTPASNYSLGNDGAAAINAAVAARAATDPRLFIVPTNARDLDTRFSAGDSLTDGIHYSADAYQTLGRRLAAAAGVPEPSSATLAIVCLFFLFCRNTNERGCNAAGIKNPI